MVSNGVLYDKTPPVEVTATLVSKLAVKKINVQKFAHLPSWRDGCHPGDAAIPCPTTFPSATM